MIGHVFVCVCVCVFVYVCLGFVMCGYFGNMSTVPRTLYSQKRSMARTLPN